MSYEEIKLLSLLKKQDIDSLFLEATNYLCQTKSLFEEKKQLQQGNEQLKDNWNKLKEIIKKNFVSQGGFTSYEWNDLLNELLDKMQEIEGGVSDDNN